MKRRKKRISHNIAISVLIALMLVPANVQVYAGTTRAAHVMAVNGFDAPVYAASPEFEIKDEMQAILGRDKDPEFSGGNNHILESMPEPNEVRENTASPTTEFDPQPISREDVAENIALYGNRLAEYLINQDETPQKPRWKFEVDAKLMPHGYSCAIVEHDENFGEVYYTFFTKISLMAANWDGEGTSASPYRIREKEDLDMLAAEVNSGTDYTGVHFKLENDIDFAGQAWVPIGVVSNGIELSLVPNTSNMVGTDTAFKGIFDGGHFTIKNFKVDAGAVGDVVAADYKGLFGIIENAEIRNLNIENATVDGGSAVGVVAGYATGNITIENVHIYNSTVRSFGETNFALGGLLGVVNMKASREFTISSSSVSGGRIQSTTGYGRTGGVIGMIMSHQDEENTPINSKVNIQDIAVSDCQIIAMADSLGGLTGKISFNNSCGNRIEIKNVQTEATIFINESTGDNAGGLIGHAVISGSSIGSTMQIEDCTASGRVLAKGVFTGGFIGFCEIDVSGAGGGAAEWIKISNSYSEANILAGYNGAGGFIGRTYAGDNMTNGSILVENCFASGDIANLSSFAENTGGFIGRSSQGIVIRNSHATGDVFCFGSNNGGFMGYAEGSSQGIVSIENCYSTGHVASDADNGGGFVGKLQHAQVKNSYSAGSVFAGGSNAGGFAGYISDSRVESSYAAVHVDSRIRQGCGGFIGANDGSSVISDCFFDTTVSKCSFAVGKGNSDGITPLGTSGMTKYSSYSRSWEISENSYGAAKGAASNAKPWYIDDGVTYPYLFHQYDGKSNNETNYDLSSVMISENSGVNYTPFLQPTKEFSFAQNAARRFEITSAGAAGVFFPYSYGTHYEDYGIYKYEFSGEPIEIPSTEDYIFESNQPYSIGAISKSHIIAFNRYTEGEISSDRPFYSAGNSGTYTYVGDRLEYTVEVANHSRDFDWNGPIVSIAMPAGVNLIAEEIKVDGAVIGETGLPKYEWNSGAGELKIYIQDMPKNTGDTLSREKITFAVNIGDEATSTFPLDPGADNIRVKGSITGTLYSASVSVGSYTVPIDDMNNDPVFFKYTVSYYGNGGLTTDEQISVEEGPYLPLTMYPVKSIEEIGFTRAGYSFLGWSTQADGNGQLYSAEDEIEISSSIELYAVWIKNPVFEFYKVDGEKAADGIFEGLGGVEFTLFLWTGSSETEIYPELGESDDWQETYIELSSSDEGTKGLVSFANLHISSTYLLVETKAPAGYELPSAQWLIHVDENRSISTGDMLSGNKAFKIGTGDIDTSNEEDEAYIINYAMGENFQLPNSGGEGTLKWAMTGMGLIGLGLTAISVRVLRKKHKKLFNRQ